jgi:hypothetical protein
MGRGGGGVGWISPSSVSNTAKLGADLDVSFEISSDCRCSAISTVCAFCSSTAARMEIKYSILHQLKIR